MPDLPGPRCALRGLASALAAARAERVLVLATDLPLVGDELLLGLCAWPEADAVLARDAEGPQPLCAVYRRERALAVARRRLAPAASSRCATCWSSSRRACSPSDVQRALDPDGSALTNVNTPEELERLEARLRASAKSSN